MPGLLPIDFFRAHNYMTSSRNLRKEIIKCFAYTCIKNYLCTRSGLMAKGTKDLLNTG
jgi:hypothetical protein